MKLVVDANIIIAALIARSVTLRLILDDRLTLITSGFAFDEINSHMKEITGKAQLNEGEMHVVMARIRDRIAVERPTDKILLEKAFVASPDKDDAQYFALALKHKCPIWSNDKALVRQGAVRIISTKELIGILDLKD